MRAMLLPVLMISLAIPAQVEASDGKAISLPKQGKWEVNYDVDSCHLLGKFGTGKDEVVMRITRYQPSDWFDLTLFGNPVDLNNSTQVKVELGFGTQKAAPSNAVVGNAGKDRPMLIFSNLRLDGWQPNTKSKTPVVPPLITPDQEGGVQSIAFKLPARKRYQLETGSMAKPLAALRQCNSDLVKYWGFDPAVQASLTRWATPLSDPARWLGTRDFPTKSLENGHNGLVQFRLDVDETGKVSTCRVLYRTNPDDFADLSCKLISQRAKFAAALDAAGKPVRSYYISKILWVVAG